MPPSTSQQPKPIPLPLSLTSSTPSLPTPTQEALIAHLRSTNAIPDLSHLLADSLARTGWTDRVRALCLELLRNGSCDTFPELMSEVMRRAKIPKPSFTTSNTAANGAGTTTNGTSTPTPSQSGGNGINGGGAITVSKEWSGGPDGLPDVRIPEVTVEAGVEFLREKVKDVVEYVDEDDDD